MGDQRLFIEVRGIGPNDVPTREDEPARRDTAVDIADDVHDLLREEYDCTGISGVAVVVNQDVHEQRCDR